ncbi:hypothetical protein U9M48_036830 [Paspalum notatum var. saurae]|uniref:Rx N-terminal domain-containing protein n=1 Tax=Paspalum notatum var. saurae TaxID=547442 RepID=A0AAQ3XBM4_PASNO
MAELASGAVRSLLGLLRNEALLLSRVGSDVEFIKEEMESMHSFLEHLARTAPPAGGHDEQVRTWMKQVRDLAYDCSNCIDLYLRRNDPAVYRAGGGRRRYLWWASWLLQKMITQHNAAIRLRELKERARDVGNRRMRYGVEIPRKEAVALRSQDALSIQGGEEGEEEEKREAAVVANCSADPRQRPLERPCLLEDYCAEKLDSWLGLQAETKDITSIAIAGANITPESLNLATTHTPYWINLSELHNAWDVPMLSWEILTYILLQFDDRNVGEGTPCGQAYHYKCGIKKEMLDVIDDDDIDKKIEGIKSKIVQVDERKIGGGMDIKKLGEENKSLGILLHVLKLERNETIKWEDLSSSDDYMGQVAATLKFRMEGKSKTKISLDVTQYIDILRKVFPASSQPQLGLGLATTGGEDHINEVIVPFLKNINEIIHKQLTTSPRQQLQAANSAPTTDDQVLTSAIDAATKETNKGIITEAATINDTKKKMDKISSRIKYMMIIKGIVDKIRPHLENKKALIILQDDQDYVSIKDDKFDAFPWEETIKALNLLGCAPGSAVIVSTKNIQKAKEFCNPRREPIACSLAGFYLDIVFQLTEQQIGGSGYDPCILCKILDKCHPHEFCMKMLLYALHANPKRSNEELQKLLQDLGVTQNTFDCKTKTMIRFSYKDLPREYKTCLLYLAIFPQGHIIRRSTLIGRWVTEGLITKQDWRTAVVYAERCLDALIKRGLVLPCDIGAAGKVKSCMVGYEVHGFITKVATKENIMDARLSDLWARHFSIFSGLRLRTSDSIDKFVQNLPNYSPQLPLLKVLDLEGTNCFDNNQYCLKDICNKILLLKYLSLRRTNVSHLPREINNLHELEVLDIRQTKVPKHATRHVLLLKLRRFMANRTDPGMNYGNSRCSPVQIPLKISKMENLEVLSNVRASGTGSELRDIRHLWQLRELGVAIQDKRDHLDNLLRAVGDLKDCLGLRHGAYNGKKLTFKGAEFSGLKYFLIDGTDNMTGIQESMVETDIEFQDGAAVELEKIVLSCTNIRSLSGIDNLPELKELELKGNEFLHSFLGEGSASRQNNESLDLEQNTQSKAPEQNTEGGRAPEQSTESSDPEQQNTQDRTPEQNTESRAADQTIESQSPEQNTKSRAPEQSSFTFNKEKFKNLKYFCLEHSKMTKIVFEDGAAPELKKIALSLTNTGSKVTGVKDLPKLKDADLKGDKFLLSFFHSADKIAKVTLRDTQLNQADMDILAKKPNLCCLELLDGSYNDENGLTFKNNDFPKLGQLIVDCPRIMSISFTQGSAPKLEKIVWSFTEMKSLSGIGNLLKLKEIECMGDQIPHQVRKDIAAHKERPVFTHKKPQQQCQPKEEEENCDACFPPISRFMKIKNQR